jgi:hypothetical protein
MRSWHRWRSGRRCSEGGQIPIRVNEPLKLLALKPEFAGGLQSDERDSLFCRPSLHGSDVLGPQELSGLLCCHQRFHNFHSHKLTNSTAHFRLRIGTKLPIFTFFDRLLFTQFIGRVTVSKG